MPTYPNVPNVHGVPPLLRDPQAALSAFTQNVLTADTATFPINQTQPQWGIFQDGQPVVLADNVASFEYKQAWTISDYPVEQGGFESYDKVNSPFDVRLRFSRGGSEQDREEFLASIEDIAGTTDLYDVVTPERTYSSVNINNYAYSRTALNGVGLMVVEIWGQEIRVTATADFTNSNTKSADGADTANDGTVQPASPTPQQSALSSIVG